jgi:hypothetical protein
MWLLFRVFLVCISIGTAVCQGPSYERGTIVAVARHSGSENTDVVRYDVSIQIRDTIYVVLYTPPNGANSVEYAAGIDMLFLVGRDTLTFNSNISGTTEMPILRTETVPTKSVLDWSKAPSQYFSMKMQHLSQSLDLTADQQAKIKPIVEQEAGDAGQVCFTTTIPLQERLNRWEKIVHSSDEKMKSILSQTQWQKLQEMRKQQKQELKKLMANEGRQQ